MGYWVNTIAKYSDIYVKVFDVYNTCDLDYYMIAMGTNFTTVQGGVDFVVSCLWLYFLPDSQKAAGTDVIKFNELLDALGRHNA